MDVYLKCPNCGNEALVETWGFERKWKGTVWCRSCDKSVPLYEDELSEGEKKDEQ